MVDVIGRAKVIITGDVDSTSIDKAGGKIGSSLKAGALVGVAALGTVAAAGFKAFQAFEEAESVSRVLNNTLGNMGKSGATESVEKLADALMRKTGVDDEVIKKGQAILATFSEVASSAGEVGGAFERASVLSLDLAATGFGSVDSASKALGKALQDPVKGVAMLSRAGVTFTAEQKELIKTLVESGDLLAAQNIVLAEVEKQVGGNAEAASKASTKISTAFGELEESAGNLITKLAGGGEGDKGGGLTGAIYGVSDALNRTAESKAWDDLGKDIRGTGGKVGDLTSGLFRLDQRIGTTILKLPQFGRGLRNLIDPTHGVIGVVLDLVDALRGLNKELDGNSGKIIGNENNTEFGNSDFIDQITGAASGGPVRGLRLVGENGPELAQFGGSGGYVYNNSQTRDILGDAARGSRFELTQIFTGPNSLAEARREADWARTYGTRFGSATSAGAL